MSKAKKPKKKLPKFLQSVLWSYDLDAFDPDNPFDRRLIITQVLNHGSWKQIQWLLNYYSKKDLVEALKNPPKGVWYKDSLNYWLEMLNLKLPKETYQKAIFNLHPQNDTLAHT